MGALALGLGILGMVAGVLLSAQTAGSPLERACLIVSAAGLALYIVGGYRLFTAIDPSTGSGWASLGRITFGVTFVILTFVLVLVGLLVVAMLTSTD